MTSAIPIPKVVSRIPVVFVWILVAVVSLNLMNVASTSGEEIGLSLGLSVKLKKPGDAIIAQIENTGSKDLRIWRNATSWDWNSLSLVVVRNGHVYVYKRRPVRAVTRDPIRWETIKPAGVIERRIDLSRGWIFTSGAPRRFSPSDGILVEYSVITTPESLNLHIWSGCAAAQMGHEGSSNRMNVLAIDDPQ